MMSKANLKPRPFCGEKMSIWVMSSASTKSILRWVCCNKCFAVSGAAETIDGAIALWNTRAYEKEGDDNASEN